MNNLKILEWMGQFEPLSKLQEGVSIKRTTVLTEENFEELTNAAFKKGDSVELLSSGEIGKISAIDLDDETVLVYVGNDLVRLDVFDIQHIYMHFWEQDQIWRVVSSEMAQWILENIDSVSNCGFRIGQDYKEDVVFLGYSNSQLPNKIFRLMYALYTE